MPIPLTKYLPNGAMFSNPVAKNIHRLGSLFTLPTSTSLTLISKLIRPLKPGLYGQWTSTSKEIARRVLFVFAILLLLPLNVTLGSFGAALRCLASCARKDFIYIKPKKEPAPRLLSPSKLKICTYNTALMPEFIAARNEIPPTSERVEVIAQALQKRNDDIVCMQEAFHADASLELSRRLTNYPYQILDVANQRLGLSSGLMIASKYPLENIKFWRHPESSGLEQRTNKGLLAATVRLSAHKMAYIFNTHLHGGAPPPLGGKYYRRKQLKQIRKLVPTYVEEHQKKQKNTVVGVFLCGDMNIGPDDRKFTKNRNPEWRKKFFRGEYDEYYHGDGPPYTEGRLNIGQKYGTAFHSKNARDAITGWDRSKIQEWGIGRECLDHILVKQDPPPGIDLRPGKRPKVYRDHMDGGSDHLAVRTECHLI